MKTNFLAIASIGLLMATAIADELPVQYTLIDLGVFEGGSSSEAYGINIHGQVVGGGDSSDGTRAFVWDNGTMSDLGTITGGTASFARGINDTKQVVGIGTNSSGLTRAFLWQNDEMTDLGAFSETGWSNALSINDSGQIVGASNNTAALWLNGSEPPLELDGVNGLANDVNNTQQIVGKIGNTASLWQNDIVINLGTLGGSNSVAYGINDKGQVVGSSSTEEDGTRAFLWKDGTLMNLGILDGSGMTISEAYGINSYGQIVGTSKNRGFIAWLDNDDTPNMFDLNDLLAEDYMGWTLVRARDINDHGEIVGVGLFNGQLRAFLLKPMPPWIPEVTLSAEAEGEINAPVTVTATVNKSVETFNVDALSVTNGSISDFSGTEASYSFVVTPDSEGPFTVWVEADAFFDTAGNPNQASNVLEWIYDVTPPEVMLSAEATGDVNASVTVTATLNKAVEAFSVDALSVTNGSISDFSGTEASYSFVVTPDSEGPFTVWVEADAFFDTAGNPNQASNVLEWIYDVTPPEVMLSAEATGDVNASVTVTATLNKAVEAFSVDALSVTNGSISDFSGTEASYSFVVTPDSEGPFTVWVEADAFFDTAGNPNQASNVLEWIYDVTPPEVMLSAEATGVIDGPVVVTVALSEVVEGVIDSIVSVVNGRIEAFTGANQSYTFEVHPEEAGPVTVRVAEGRLTDPAGNANSASNTLTWEYAPDNDPLEPVQIALVGPDIQITTSGPVQYQVSYIGADSIVLEAGDVVLHRTGSATGEIAVSGSGNERTITISGITGTGTLWISIAAETAFNASGAAPSAGPSAAVEVIGLEMPLPLDYWSLTIVLLMAGALLTWRQSLIRRTG